jgi:protease I
MIEKSILVVLPARDFNEQEYLNVKNILEKSNFKLFIASDAYALCVGNNGLKVRPDVSFLNINEKNFAAILFIGGSGVKNYWDNSNLHIIARSFHKNKKPIAAICSAPVILAKAGLLSNIEATSYPADKTELEREGAKYKDLPVVVDQKIITAQGAAAVTEFSNAVIDQISKRFSL